MSSVIRSEQELIETYLAPLAAGEAGARGLRDDCATYAPPAGEHIVLTTDAVAAGVHFFADDRPEDIAWKALAVNVSDLAAKAAVPRIYQMALSFPDAPEHAFMARFAEGLRAAQEAFGITLTGGDTDRRPGPFTVTITALGSVPAGSSMARSAAKPGDRLYVTGTIGAAAIGLKLRQGGAAALPFQALPEATREFCLSRYLRPQPRLDARDLLQAVARASLDLSDGLAKDLGRLAVASGLAARVEVDALPMPAGMADLVRQAPDLRDLILAGGDDYEILFSAPADRHPAVLTLSAALGIAVSPIGSLEHGQGVTYRDASTTIAPPARPGWEHF